MKQPVQMTNAELHQALLLWQRVVRMRSTFPTFNLPDPEDLPGHDEIQAEVFRRINNQTWMPQVV
jgi:hypothetical protein